MREGAQHGPVCFNQNSVLLQTTMNELYLVVVLYLCMLASSTPDADWQRRLACMLQLETLGM